jgi:hypothetical protein
MTATIATVCDICGARGVVIRHAVVRWLNPVFGQYEKVDRCQDVETCKRRVAETGEEWPVEDPR